VSKLASNIKGLLLIEGVREQNAEEHMWTYGEGRKRRLEKFP
jgi:hypothetical protein